MPVRCDTPLWTDESTAITYSSHGCLPPNHYPHEGDNSFLQGRNTHQNSCCYGLAQTTPLATQDNRAFVASGSAAEYYYPSNAATQQSQQDVFSSDHFPYATNEPLDGHDLFDVDLKHAEPYCLSCYEHYSQTEGLDLYPQDPEGPSLQHLQDSCAYSSVAMGQGRSQQSAISTNSRDSRRSRSSNVARYVSPPYTSSTDLTPVSLKIDCEVCGKSYNGVYRKRNLLRHVQTAHGICLPVYACKVSGCDLSYRRSDALRAHERRKHPELLRRGPS